MQTKHLCVSIHICTKCEVGAVPSSKNIFTDRSKAVILLWIIFVIYVCHADLSDQCSLVVTCWEKVNLLDLVYGALLCFSLSLWCLWSSVYFIVLIPDLCLLTYFHA